MVPRVQRDSWAPAGDTTGFSVKMEEVAPAFLSLCPSSGHPVTRPSSNTTKVAKLRFEPRTLFTPSYSLKGGGEGAELQESSKLSFLFCRWAAGICRVQEGFRWEWRGGAPLSDSSILGLLSGLFCSGVGRLEATISDVNHIHLGSW